MSGKEAPRPGMLEASCDERITNGEAAVALHLTVRQVQRLKGRYREGGAAGLVHRGRGQPSPQRLADPVRAQIATLMTTVYAGFTDAHLTEKLREDHGLAVSRPTVRRIRRRLGRPATRDHRARPHRQRRLREAAAGSLVQIDGSPLVRDDRHWTLAEELQGPRHPTHLGRILQERGVGFIAAHSPQAQGRVERLWQPLQDRLVSELRLRGISTRADANAFLPAFLADFNRRFTVPPRTPTAVWRRPPRTLAQILSCRYSCAWPGITPSPSGRAGCSCRAPRSASPTSPPAPQSAADQGMTFSLTHTYDILTDHRHRSRVCAGSEARSRPAGRAAGGPDRVLG